MWGVTTQVSTPNIKTSYTMDEYNQPDVWANTYPPSIIDRRSHICRTIWIFLMTSVQSSYVVVRIRPRYQKGFIISRGWTYALKEVSVPAYASSSDILYCFRSDPLVHIPVVLWWMFSANYSWFQVEITSTWNPHTPCTYGKARTETYPRIASGHKITT